MKSDTDLKSNSNLSNCQSLNTSNFNLNANQHGNQTNQNMNQANLTTAQRKTAIHDLTQILIDDCQKLMIECQKSISKYHNNLLCLSNGSLNETINKDELRSLRIQNYKNLKLNLERLLPQIDQVNFNDNELYNYIQQIIAYLEYLKLEFIRHFYILKSFYFMQNDTRITSQLMVRPITSDLNRNDAFIGVDLNRKVELIELQYDINEIESFVHKLTQKYYIFVPDLSEIKTWNKKGSNNYSNMGSFNLFSKCKFICCFCSPKYI